MTSAVALNGAIVTDSANVNAFSTGGAEISPLTTTDLLNFSNPALVPNGSVVDSITATNAGSVALRDSITSTTTEHVLGAETAPCVAGHLGGDRAGAGVRA
ncbi:MAG: hypothetical protein AB7L17_23850 [Ilumatobacteraceae bacterium]